MNIRTLFDLRLATLGLIGLRTLPKHRTVPAEKPCIVCGKLKRHNNAFCSAECCRQHKAGN